VVNLAVAVSFLLAVTIAAVWVATQYREFLYIRHRKGGSGVAVELHGSGITISTASKCPQDADARFVCPRVVVAMDHGQNDRLADQIELAGVTYSRTGQVLASFNPRYSHGYYGEYRPRRGGPGAAQS
jgi:hypothetical protein